MKAVVYEKYGSPDLLHLAEVEKPTPNDDEILIKVRAVSVNGSDREGLTGKPLYARMGGLLKPSHNILGADIAGRVESVGKNNTEFKPGDEVFGEIPGYHGGFAEYVRTHGKTMALKPAGLTFEEAAAIPQAGVIALQGICEKGKVEAGQKVLINGAGGSAGPFAVQLAKLYGAEVTGVDNTNKLDFIHSLGADHVIDYTKENFTTNGRQYDLILDLIAHRSVFSYQRALRPAGSYFFVGGSAIVMFQILLIGPLIKRAAKKNIRILVVPQNRKDLISITQLCEAGKVKPVIDKRFSLNETPEALRYVIDGHAKGKVVIAVQPNGKT
ncbi:MAG: NAD(P)-dependent alcohol dehydrogenase [Ignavibacteriales bacterium]|nr:NAD(P)-dependent alcohol dehydrogenase [Ignavibacteriales bacterium]